MRSSVSLGGGAAASHTEPGFRGFAELILALSRNLKIPAAWQQSCTKPPARIVEMHA